MMQALAMVLRGIGRRVVDGVWRMGVATRFFALTLLYSGQCFRRPGLIVREIFSSGVLSLIIILVSGLFVGMVLGLQGYETLGNTDLLAVPEAVRTCDNTDGHALVRKPDADDLR